MKSGWLGLVPAMLALIVLTHGAIAQEDTTPAAGGSVPLTMHISAADGFSIGLPSAGTVTTPESPDWGWGDTPEVAMHWAGSGPVKEIIVHCHKFQLPVTLSTYREFTSSLEQNFVKIDADREAELKEDKAAKVKELLGTQEKFRKSFRLGDDKGMRNTPVPSANGSIWNLLAVSDMRDENRTIGYSILSTWGGQRIYTVTLIYMGELNDSIKKVGGAVISSLNDPAIPGPLGVEPVPGVVMGEPAGKTGTGAA